MTNMDKKGEAEFRLEPDPEEIKRSEILKEASLPPEPDPAAEKKRKESLTAPFKVDDGYQMVLREGGAAQYLLHVSDIDQFETLKDFIEKAIDDKKVSDIVKQILVEDKAQLRAVERADHLTLSFAGVNVGKLSFISCNIHELDLENAGGELLLEGCRIAVLNADNFAGQVFFNNSQTNFGAKLSIRNAGGRVLISADSALCGDFRGSEVEIDRLQPNLKELVRVRQENLARLENIEREVNERLKEITLQYNDTSQSHLSSLFKKAYWSREASYFVRGSEGSAVRHYYDLRKEIEGLTADLKENDYAAAISETREEIVSAKEQYIAIFKRCLAGSKLSIRCEGNDGPDDVLVAACLPATQSSDFEFEEICEYLERFSERKRYRSGGLHFEIGNDQVTVVRERDGQQEQLELKKEGSLVFCSGAIRGGALVVHPQVAKDAVAHFINGGSLANDGATTLVDVVIPG